MAAAGLVQRERREGLASLPSGSTLPLTSNCKRQREEVCKSLDSERNLQQILSLHLVGLQGIKKERKERRTWVRVLMAEFKFEFEPF
jgi:hypothetical protein